MSAWPEAVWVIREVQKAIGANDRLQRLDARLTVIENRYLIIATSTNEGVPSDLSYTPSDGSLWMKVVTT